MGATPGRGWQRPQGARAPSGVPALVARLLLLSLLAGLLIDLGAIALAIAFTA